MGGFISYAKSYSDDHEGEVYYPSEKINENNLNDDPVTNDYDSSLSKSKDPIVIEGTEDEVYGTHESTTLSEKQLARKERKDKEKQEKRNKHIKRMRFYLETCNYKGVHAMIKKHFDPSLNIVKPVCPDTIEEYNDILYEDSVGCFVNCITDKKCNGIWDQYVADKEASSGIRFESPEEMMLFDYLISISTHRTDYTDIIGSLITDKYIYPRLIYNLLFLAPTIGAQNLICFTEELNIWRDKNISCINRLVFDRLDMLTVSDW